MPKKQAVFGKKEFTEFSRLIEIPSHNADGQNRKIQLIEKMINERVAAVLKDRQHAIYRKTRNLLAAERTVQNEHKRTFKMRSYTVPVDPLSKDPGQQSWKNLIVTLGDPSTALYHVLIPSHIDTVEADSVSQLTLTPDVDNPDRLLGRGAWDMLAQAYNGIELTSVPMPPEICTHIAFTVDEETNSSGARSLIERWSGWKMIDAVISQEIGPLPERPKDGDDFTRLLLGRSGRQKFEIEVEVPSGGHFASRKNKWNASKIVAQLALDLEEMFQKTKQVTEPHFALGPSEWEDGDLTTISSKRGLRPNVGLLEFAIQARPGYSFRDQEKLIEELIEEIRKKRGWPADVELQLRPFSKGVSYNPFFMPSSKDKDENPALSQHSLVTKALEAIHAVTGRKGVLSAGTSVADENLYAASLVQRTFNNNFLGTDKGVISIPPQGNNAHDVLEWVSGRSILETRKILVHLLTSNDGLRKLAVERRRTKK